MRAALLLALALVPAGCGGDDGGDRTGRPSTRLPAPAATAPKLRPLHCPRDAANCRAAGGRVVYVEAHDPDGDGDAHFVLASRQQVSGPGITVIDVERELRPRRLPRVGDLVVARGPVYRGSYGQRQIQATAIRIARLRPRAP